MIKIAPYLGRICEYELIGLKTTPFSLEMFSYVKYHRVASTPELATNFIDYKQMAGMTTVRKSCSILFYHGVMR